jgi:hypothetical protein
VIREKPAQRYGPRQRHGEKSRAGALPRPGTSRSDQEQKRCDSVRGGWKITRAKWLGRQAPRWCGIRVERCAEVTETGPCHAQVSTDRESVIEGTGAGGGPGSPEQDGPAHGRGRSRSVAGSGGCWSVSAEARTSGSRKRVRRSWPDREVTCEVQPAQDSAGATKMHAKSAASAPISESTDLGDVKILITLAACSPELRRRAGNGSRTMRLNAVVRPCKPALTISIRRAGGNRPSPPSPAGPHRLYAIERIVGPARAGRASLTRGRFPPDPPDPCHPIRRTIRSRLSIVRGAVITRPRPLFHDRDFHRCH